MAIDIRVDLGMYLAIFLALTGFGIGFNSLVQWMERKHYTEGFLSLIVALGVFVTLLGVAILSWQAALIALGCFIASGLPMIVGSIVRYMRIRAEHINALKRGDYDL